MTRYLLATLAAAGLMTAACGSPEVPDEQQAREYRSTAADDDADQTNQTNAATGQQSPDGQPASAGDIRATGPVATVDGEPIAADEFNKEIERLQASMQTSQLPPQFVQQVSGQIVQKLVDRRLIENEIERQNVEVTEAEVDAKMQEVRDEFEKASQQMGQQASLESLVQQLGITEKELRDSIEQSIAIEKILENRGLKAPAPEEVRAFYDENKARFEQPEQVKASHILIQVDANADQATWDAAQKRAEMVRAEVTKDGADFAAVAREKSEDSSAPAGGDLGYFARGRMVPEFEEAAFGLKKGEVSKPVKTDFGWHVIKVEDRKEAGTVPFEEIDEELGKQMKNERINEGLVALLDELRTRHDVQIHEDNIVQ